MPSDARMITSFSTFPPDLMQTECRLHRNFIATERSVKSACNSTRQETDTLNRKIEISRISDFLQSLIQSQMIMNKWNPPSLPSIEHQEHMPG